MSAFDSVTAVVEGPREAESNIRARASYGDLIEEGKREGFRSKVAYSNANFKLTYQGSTIPVSWSELLGSSKPFIDCPGGPFSLEMEQYPFSKGHIRAAYRAVLRNGRGKEKRVVVKEFMVDTYKFEESCYAAQSEISACATFIIEDFNKKQRLTAAAGGKTKNIVSLPSRVLKIFDRKKRSVVRLLNIEDYIEVGGDIVKWCNNSGTYMKYDMPMDLINLSIYSYEISGRQLLISDLQGFNLATDYVITDPAILFHFDKTRFRPTNTYWHIDACVSLLLHRKGGNLRRSSASSRAPPLTCRVALPTSSRRSSILPIPVELSADPPPDGRKDVDVDRDVDVDSDANDAGLVFKAEACDGTELSIFQELLTALFLAAYLSFYIWPLGYNLGGDTYEILLNLAEFVPASWFNQPIIRYLSIGSLWFWPFYMQPIMCFYALFYESRNRSAKEQTIMGIAISLGIAVAIAISKKFAYYLDYTAFDPQLCRGGIDFFYKSFYVAFLPMMILPGLNHLFMYHYFELVRTKQKPDLELKIKHYGILYVFLHIFTLLEKLEEVTRKINAHLRHLDEASLLIFNFFFGLYKFGSFLLYVGMACYVFILFEVDVLMKFAPKIRGISNRSVI